MQKDVPFYHPSSRFYRFTILFFTSLLTFGSYFAYDIIGAIAPRLIEELGAARETVGSFYTMYSIAAIISVLVGGFLIDRLGTRLASMIFSVLVLLGSVLVAFAGSIPLLMAGRFIFGAGSEPLVVAQSAILARWFKGKELAFSFGIALTVSRLGTLFSFNTGELIANYYGGARYALIAAMLFVIVSLLANIVYVLMDRHAEKSVNLHEEGVEEKIVFKDIKNFKASFWYIAMLCVLFYSAIFPFTALSTDFFVDKWNVPRVAESTYIVTDEALQKLQSKGLPPEILKALDQIKGKKIKGETNLVKALPHVEIEHTFKDYKTPIQQLTNSKTFLEQVFDGLLHMFSTAGGISSIIIFASMVLAPFAGGLVDKLGRRASLMLIGSIIMIPSYLMMALTTIYPVYSMIILGAAFVLVPAAMWPAVPLIVKKEHVGTAFGLITFIQNLGLALFPYLNGKLRDLTHTYTASMLMFAGLGVLGLIFAVLLKRADAKAGGVLERA